MKNRLYSLSIYAVLLIPFVAPWEGGPSANGGVPAGGIALSAAYKNAASFMPVIDLDLADLDVRDARNQPVQGAEARDSLAALFMDNLFNLAVLSSLHGISQILSDLELLSRLFHNLIFNIASTLARALPSALQPPSKRFVHNVHNLWTVFIVGIFLRVFMCINLSAKPAAQTSQLRC